ncbi:hypothetical protein JMJ56_25625 [Belnapia sp. T18]|uniref:Uncharacterized protein n=1 Tax=Belnapia arida TaxID=2804533 RepID=A0ABS1U9L3_9PROT|nr:hypothetical protein [Belnapia arida]MBL6081380.1 hypothetical protein [Belnapia arida]
MQQNSAPRWVIPATDDLIYAIGRVVYNFAQLERSAETMRRLGAGRPSCRLPNLSWKCFVQELEHVVADAPDGEELPSQMLRLSRRYIELRVRRDALLGATSQMQLPQAEGSMTRLGSDGATAHAWPLNEILRTARDIELTAIEINRLLRRRL